ncbi:MAG TPA: hypothetical protein VJ715_01680, partial [Pyrinomonadaceae bacterium]|nr:hypothetical protein [Pyrinomonadaceae bacterium]
MTARVETTRLVQAEAEARAEGQGYLERYRAPFSLRCGALLIDYILLVAIIAFSTVLARFGGRPRALAGERGRLPGSSCQRHPHPHGGPAWPRTHLQR